MENLNEAVTGRKEGEQPRSREFKEDLSRQEMEKEATSSHLENIVPGCGQNSEDTIWEAEDALCHEEEADRIV